MNDSNINYFIYVLDFEYGGSNGACYITVYIESLIIYLCQRKILCLLKSTSGKLMSRKRV